MLKLLIIIALVYFIVIKPKTGQRQAGDSKLKKNGNSPNMKAVGVSGQDGIATDNPAPSKEFLEQEYRKDVHFRETISNAKELQSVLWKCAIEWRNYKDSIVYHKSHDQPWSILMRAQIYDVYGKLLRDYKSSKTVEERKERERLCIEDLCGTKDRANQFYNSRIGVEFFLDNTELIYDDETYLVEYPIVVALPENYTKEDIHSIFETCI